MRRPKKPPKDPQLRLQEQYLVYAKNKLFKEKVVKEKAVRKDVQERALTNANSTFTVVKTTWKELGRRAVRLLDLETALLEVSTMWSGCASWRTRASSMTVVPRTLDSACRVDSVSD